jgi:glycosyltransferase involved in cell wall biosynthesis
VESICFDETVPSRHVGFSLEFAKTLRRRIRQFDVVHIHAVWNFPTWYTMWTAWRSGVPYMVAPQGSLEPWAYSSGHWLRRVHAKFAERPLLNRASRLQALTDAEVAQFAAFGLTAPSVVIPNGVAMDWLEPPAGRVIEGLGFGNNVRVVLYLSRLHPKKGLDILLRAFADLSRLVDNVMLVVAGDDAGSGYGEAMRDLADSLGLGGRCVFISEVRGERKRAVLRRAELYVLPRIPRGCRWRCLRPWRADCPC